MHAAKQIWAYLIVMNQPKRTKILYYYDIINNNVIWLHYKKKNVSIKFHRNFSRSPKLYCFYFLNQNATNNIYIYILRIIQKPLYGYLGTYIYIPTSVLDLSANYIRIMCYYV